MKYFVLLFLGIGFLSSCNNLAENEYLTRKNLELQKRVDSLERELTSITNKGGNKTKYLPKGAKFKNGRGNKLSDGSPSYSAAIVPIKSYKKKAKSVNYLGQCQATTKKGYQCSRNARSGGYCWQHGG